MAAWSLRTLVVCAVLALSACSSNRPEILAELPVEAPQLGSLYLLETDSLPVFGEQWTPLASGGVLATGGRCSFEGMEDGSCSRTDIVATSWLLSAVDFRWRPTAAMGVPRITHSATLLSDGRVFVIGGRTGDDLRLTALSEFYDPELSRWSPGPPLNYPRSVHTALALGGDRVLVVGGEQGELPGAPAEHPPDELYDPALGRFVVLPPRPSGCRRGMALRLPSGRALVASKYNDPAHPGCVDIFDPDTQAWSPGPALPIEGRAASPVDGVEWDGYVVRTESCALVRYLESEERWEECILPFYHEKFIGTLFSLSNVDILGLFEDRMAVLKAGQRRWSWLGRLGLPSRFCGHDSIILSSGLVLMRCRYTHLRLIFVPHNAPPQALLGFERE